MATETKYAENLSYTGGLVNGSNGYGSPDTNWTGNTSNSSWSCVYDLEHASANLNGLQTVTIKTRKTGGGNPTLYAELRLGSTGSPIGNVNPTITSLTSQDVVLTATSTEQTDWLQVYLSASATGGSASNRSTVQIESITWNAVIVDSATASTFMAWNGSSWVPGLLKRWDGSQWVDTIAKRWNGSSWVNVP